MDIHYGRKKNGIRRHLKAKLDDWMDSIDDPEVAKMVEKDTIVTGGSIASMLLGDKINDYDVYFKTKETALAVAEYYCNQFIANNKLVAMNEYEPEVQEQSKVNIKGDVEDRVIIYMKSAGVAAEEEEEYKYFEQFGEDETVDFAESLIKERADTDEEKGRYRPVFLSQNAITLSHKMQIIIRFYGEPEEIHANYDFAHAMNYYDYGLNELVLKQEALECLLSRTLVYRGSLYPLCSIIRLRKFISRGWRVSAGQMLKIMWQISEIDLSDHETLSEQIQGVDAAYFYQLTNALKSTDPEKINSSYVAAIIDRIFDEN